MSERAGGKPRKSKLGQRAFLQNVVACERPLKGVVLSRDGNHAVYILDVAKKQYLFNTNDFQGWKDAMSNKSSPDYRNQKGGYPKDGFEKYTEDNGYIRPLMMRERQIIDYTAEGSCAAVANAIARLFKMYDGTKEEKLEKLIRFLLKSSTTTTLKIIEESMK